MKSKLSMAVIATLVFAPAVTYSSSAEAWFVARRAAFVGGVAAGAVLGSAARAAAWNSYYAPMHYYPGYAPPAYVPACGYYPYPPCY
jgi:hypothetical protein